jgi:hypothetical protein
MPAAAMIPSPLPGNGSTVGYRRFVDPDHPWSFSLLISVGYALAYVLLAWPQPLYFWSHSWMDGGDGLVMLWNVWLAGEQGLNFWATDMIFAPEGVPLLTHSYAPLKGWIGALLPLPLVPSANLLILLSFALAGTFTFWVARRFAKPTWACLLAGYAFTFTGFHWAHAQGHMNLLSIEVLPLFALVWLRYEDQPTWPRAAAVAATLLAVALTDYYFAIYCGLLAILFMAGRRMSPGAIGRIAALTIPTTGALALAVWRVSTELEILGAHDPSTSPLDPLAMIVPGAHSRLGEVTQAIWSGFAGNIHENTVHFGVFVWVVILWKARCRRWWTVLIVFAVLALGEQLSVLGHTLPVPLPYQLLERIFPPIALGGVPVRMVVMAALAASVLLAMGIARFQPGHALPIALLIMAELAPTARPLTEIDAPDWVQTVRDDSRPGALFDPISPPGWAMVWQTIHQRPISGGSVARTPYLALALNDRRLNTLMTESPAALVQAGFGFVLVNGKELPDEELLWQQRSLRLYRLTDASP